MILGAAIGLIIVGIIALVKGKLQLTKNKYVYGTPARLLALVALAPIPLWIMIIGALAVGNVAQGREVTAGSLQWTSIGIEVGVLLTCVALIYGIGWKIAETPRQ